MNPPRKLKNIERRGREYLSPVEIEYLITAAKQSGRYGQRDATMILLLIDMDCASRN